MQSTDVVENSESAKEIKSTNVGSCNLTSPVNAMASDTVLPNGRNSFDCDRCVDDGEVSEVESSILDSEDLEDTHRFLLPSDDLGEQDQGIDPETRSKLETLLEAAGLHGQSGIDAEILRRLTSSLCSSVSTFSRHSSEPEPAVEGVATDNFMSKPEELLAVRQLLDGGRGLQETTDEGESLLCLACSAGYLELAQVLLAMRANVEDRGVKGDCTPLMEAASGGYFEIVRLLIEHGADVNAQSSAGNTPLHYAACGGHEDIIRVLLAAGANVEEHNENGHTPLMEAASAGHVGAAKTLLDAGAGINTHSNEFKESALTLACYKGHLEMVKFLLDAGADQEHKTDEMHTALMEAAMDGHVDVARLLLEHGAQVNMPADSFESPLTLAACGGHVELANLLIERGANLEEVNDEGYTPLMEAAREGHEEMVALLLAHGAEINAQTEETQETALTLACCGGFLEVVDLLVKTLANVELGCSKPLMEASQEGHIEVVKYLIRAGANVNAQTQTGDTALTYACENGHTDVASVLLEAGAELEHKSEGGRTPLMKAARAGHMQTVQFLLSKGANPNQQTVNNDHTVLSLAAAGGHTTILELLLRAGANPLHKLKDDSTVIIEAAKGGHTAVVSLLLDWHPPAGTDASSLISPPPSHLSSSVKGQSPARPLALPPAMPVPPVPPSTPTGMHKAADGAAMKTAPADTTTSSKTRLPDDAKTSVKNETAAAAAAASKIAVNKKPQLLEELCRFEQSIANKTAKVANILQSAERPPSTDEDKTRLLQKRRQMSSAEQAALKSTKDAAAAMAAADVAPLPTPLLPAPWQMRGANGAPWSAGQMLDETGALRLMAGAGCDDVDLLSSVMPKLDDEEQLRQQLVQLQLQQQLYHQPSGVLTSRLSPTSKVPPLDLASQFLDMNQFSQPALLSSITTKANPSVSVSSGTQPSARPPKTVDTVRPTPIGNAESSAVNSPSRTIQDVHKTTLPAKSAPAAATSQQQQPQPKKAIRDLSSLNMDMLDLPMQQKLQQLLHQPQSSLELFHQLFQQPQLQQAQKQLKAAVAAGTGAATATAGKKAKKTGAPAALPHPPSGQPAGASGAGSKADAACCTHSHHRHQHTTTCSHDVSTCANTHCHHGAQAVPLRATQDPSSAASPPPLYLTIDVDAQTESNHDTALTLACAGGHAELVRLLLQRNAQLEHRDKKGFTPLILAATAGHLEVVQILVDHSAEVEAQSERTKDTALSLACSGGRYEVVEYLLSCGANKEHRNISDYTPLSLAASGGYVNIIKLLLNAGAEINSRTGSKLGISPLMLAAMNGHTAAVKLLLDMGSDVNAMIETNRNTALTLACFQGRYEVVSLLVDRKANIEHRAKTGLTPLMEAASGGFVEVGRVLLDKGADVNAPPVPSSRDTALTIAADKGHHLFVELLIKRGAVLDVKNKKGDSPLWLACSGGHLDVVQALVNAGADVDSQDNRRVSCLMASFRKGHVKVVKWLVRRIALFPSDQECQRFIATVTDAELKKKCQQCMEIILSAKARQAVEANKYASILLQELDAEKSREETKKAAQARKREKKKAKKREKKTDSGKPDEDDDEDDDVKPEAMENIQEANSKAEVVDEERKQDLQSRVSAPFPSNFSITEVNHYIAAIQKAAATSVDNESSSGDGGVGKSARGARRKGRARPGTTRDSTSKDEVVAASSAAADVARPRNGPVADVALVCRPSQVTNSKTPTPLAETKTAKVMEISAEVKQTSTVTNEVNGRVGTMEEVKTSSSSKTDVKPSLDKNGRQMQSEKIVHQPITVAKMANNMAAKAPTAVTPRKGTRKDEDWKEVVRKSRRMTLPSNVAGRIIGRNGSHLHAIRHYTGAHLEVDKIRGSNDRLVTIKGTPEAIKHAADVVTALITRPDKEVEQLLTKMKNKLASSTNPVDLAVLDLEGKALGRSSQQLPVERISATATVTPLIATSSAASHTTVASSKPSQSLPVSSSSNFSIGVWEGLTVVGSADNRNAADAKTSASSCARQLFAAPAESIPGTKMSMPTYASSAAAKTKVVSSASSSTMSSNVLFDTSASGRSSVNQVAPTATSLPLVSPLRPDQPLPIKSTANVVDGGRLGSSFTGLTGFTTEYSPFSGGLMPDVLVGKRDVGGGDGDGRMNFASVAAAGVVGKSHPPQQHQQIKGQGHALGSAIGEGNSHPDLGSLEDLKAKAPGYKPIGQRSMASPLAGGDASKMAAARNSNKPPPPSPANVFYSQSQISPMSLSERSEDLGDPHQHGLITQNDFYEKVAAVPSAPDASSLHSNSSTPGSSSQSPRSTSEVDRRRDEYASPYQPMTLPKVESRLNPDAPDFTLPPPRQGGAIFPPFAPYLVGSGFPHVADLTSVPPPDLGLFGQHSSLLGNNSHLPFGSNRLPTNFAPFNMLAPRLPMGRPASPVVDATPDLSVAPPGFDPLGFMPPQPPAGHFAGQGQERNQIMPPQQQQANVPRPIGTGRRNVGGIGPGPYGAPMERPLSWNMSSDGPADLLPPGMLQASMMMGNLGAPPGDLVFSQAVMSAYNSDPLADLVTNDDQKVPSQQFGQPRRAAMFVNGGVSSLPNDRFDLQSSNQPWSSGKDFTNNDIRLGGWN